MKPEECAGRIEHVWITSYGYKMHTSPDCNTITGEPVRKDSDVLGDHYDLCQQCEGVDGPKEQSTPFMALREMSTDDFDEAVNS